MAPERSRAYASPGRLWQSLKLVRHQAHLAQSGRSNGGCGYEFRKDQYLLLSDADLDSVKVESSSVMRIEKFVEGGTIDPIYFFSSYYLAPYGDGGRDVYAVLCKAIAETGEFALARVVIGQRERTIALRSMSGSGSGDRNPATDHRSPKKPSTASITTPITPNT